MKVHPALLMIYIWGGCALIYCILPFQLMDNSFSFLGGGFFVVLVLTFCVGTILVPKSKNIYQIHQARIVDFRSADKMLKGACMIAISACAYDIYSTGLLDLSSAYQSRTEKADDLLKGKASQTSMAFQVAFLTYPAAFIYLVRHFIFDKKINTLKIAFFGVLPIVLVTISMGGRSPLLFAIVISFFAFKARKHMRKDEFKRPVRKSKLKPLKIALLISIPFVAIYYFAAVFIVRAEAVGGASAMFTLAENTWGVGFQGQNADFMFSLFGEELTYLIFIFSWYLIQGLFMSNFLMESYDGPLQYGVYGIDLMSALMRRIDGQVVASNFDALMELGTYGFFPSAFGSLYVDFAYGALIFCFLWGSFSGIVYYRVKLNVDARWYLLAPFVTMGVVFSLINTPIGFTNGLVIYIWLFMTFIMSKDLSHKINCSFVR